MTRVAADSTTFEDIPKNIDIACAYVNGSMGVATPAQMEARFPHSQYGWCFIDVNGSRPDAQVRDWETGDKAGSLENWIADHNDHSGQRDAVIYCNGSTIPEVRQLSGRMVLGKDYYLFVATLSGFMFTGFGVVACQRDGVQQTGGHFDRSFVFENGLWRPTGNGGNPTTNHKPDCSILQLAVHTQTDGIWGDATDRHGWAVREASERNYPYGINFAQAAVGTKPDGIWGPKSTDALIQTVKNVQNALTHMGFNTHGVDGVWGANTQSAFHAARMACHI